MRNQHVNWLAWGLVVVIVACRPLDLLATQTDIPTVTDTPVSTTAPPTETPLIPTATLELATAIPSSPTPEPMEQLAFSIWSDPDPGLAKVTVALINSDGSGFEPLTFLEPFGQLSDDGTHLAWSPDGHYLVYDGNYAEGTLQHLYLVDPSEGQIITMTDENAYWPNLLGTPAWAPDGQSLMMPLGQNAGRGLFKFDLNSLQTQRIMPPADVTDFHPAWSPNGTTIAFLRFVSDEIFPFPSKHKGQNQASLYLVQPDGSNLELLIDHIHVEDNINSSDAVYNAPAWSPDGQWLAFLVGTEQSDIKIINIITGETRTLVSSPANDLHPIWSPDGTRLAFVSDRDGNKEIYMVTADGSQVINLTHDSGNDNFPVWSLSGRQIAFLSDRGEQPSGYYQNRLYVMNADGTGQMKLSDAYVFSRPAWRPLPDP